MRYSIEPKERKYVKGFMVLRLLQEILVINIVNL